MPDVLYSQQGDTLDGLLWRERGLSASDLGPVLTANRGLAQLGPILPLGTPVTIPATAAPSPRTVPLIQLWDL